MDPRNQLLLEQLLDGFSLDQLRLLDIKINGVTYQHTHTTSGERDLDNILHSFWDLGSLGIQAPSGDPVSDQFTSSIQKNGGRYEVSHPWQEYNDPVPDNYNQSRKRLRGLLHRLKQDPYVLREYDSIIRDQLSEGVVEVVEDEESTQTKNALPTSPSCDSQGQDNYKGEDCV